MAGEQIWLRADGVVPGTPEAVWAAVADVRRRPAWLAELRRVDDGEGPAEPGTRFTGQASLLGHDLLGHGVVHEAEVGRVLVEEIVLGARLVSTWTFEAEGDGTRTRVGHALVIDYPRGPLGGLERWLVRRRLARMQRTSLAALASLAAEGGRE
jgi:uncharacterized protein YndB with AHSA1/START domain